MDDATRQAIRAAVADEKARADQRRDTLVTAFEDLKETLQTVLDEIPDLPQGLGLVQVNDLLLITPTDGERVLGESLISAKVYLIQDDEGKEKLTYMLKFVHGDPTVEGQEFDSLEAVARAIAEPLLEDTNKLADLEAMQETSPVPGPEAAGSAAPDNASLLKIQFTGIGKEGDSTEGYIAALSVQEARSKLILKGIKILTTEIVRDDQGNPVEWDGETE